MLQETLRHCIQCDYKKLCVQTDVTSIKSVSMRYDFQLRAFAAASIGIGGGIVVMLNLFPFPSLFVQQIIITFLLE